MPDAILTGLLMHPQRLRIVAALMQLGPATATEISERLPSVPSATLYRQLRTLTEIGVVMVAEERRIRGTVERVYKLEWAKARLDASALNDLSPQEVQAIFGSFLAVLAGEFEEYSQRDDRDYRRDAVMFAWQPLVINPERYEEFLNALAEAIRPFAAPPGEASTHTLSFVSLPNSASPSPETLRK